MFRTTKWLVPVACLAFGFCLAAPNSQPAFGLPIGIVDQEQTTYEFLPSIPGSSPIGQEFVPTLSGLDAVELFLAEASGSGGATVYVRIRDASISGTILGTSQQVVIPDGEPGSVFSF